MDAGPRWAPAPSVTGKRPAKSLSLSTSLPCASVMLKACTSRRLGPRVGVSVTRYAFKLPRSVTITRELGVIGKSLAASDRTQVYYLYKRNRWSLQDRACSKIRAKKRRALGTACRAFFLRTESGKFHRPLFPRFLARLGLRPANQLKQTTDAPTEIKIIAGPEFFRLRQKTVRVACVENQLPFEVFLA